MQGGRSQVSTYLLALVFFAYLGVAHGDLICDSQRYRIDCGTPTTVQWQCEDSGCCWSPIDDGTGRPWCFHKAGGYDYCSPRSDRVDCGYPGLTKEQCYNRGCCWDEKTGGPFCYFRNSNINPAICPYDWRTDCGYPGITPEQCESNGCCWSPLYGVSGPWCFHTNVKTSQK